MTVTELEPRLAPAVTFATSGAVFVQETPGPSGVGAFLSFAPFEPGYTGPISTAAIDQQFVAVGAGAGGPRVQMWERGEHGYECTFDAFAFELTFTGGVNVALADWNGDFVPDLVVGAGPGGGPRVRVLSGVDGKTLADFFPYESTFRGGVYVDGYRQDLVVAPGPGGGPRVQRYESGSLASDVLIADPSVRSFTDYAYGSINGSVRLAVLDGSTTLHTFDRDFRPERTTTLYHQFTTIGVGEYFDFPATNLIGAFGGSLVTLDEVFGIPLSHVSHPRDVQVGSYQIPPISQGPPPPLPVFAPLLGTDAGTSGASIYRSPTDTLFAGVSIGRPGGTGTYTLTARDNATGELVGLTNAHVVGVLPVISQPGPADDLDGTARQIGQVLRTSYADVDVAAFTLTEPTDSTLRLGYFDGFAGVWRELTLPPAKYDPAVSAESGDVVYKFGRTTGVTRARVESTETDVFVGYPDGVRLQLGQTVASGTLFAQPGDSGSLVVRVIGNDVFAVGQLFAGSYDRGIFVPLDRTLAAAGVTFV